MSPRRNLKPQEDGIKSGRTEQSGINLKIPNTQPARMSSKTPVRLDQQEEIDQNSTRRR
jgi:hypothetical protein